MCIAAVLFSLIPVLSAYAVYIAFATLVTRGSPAVQWAVGLLLAAALLGALTWAVRRVRRRYVDVAHAAAKPNPKTPPNREPPSTRDPA